MTLKNLLPEKMLRFADWVADTWPGKWLEWFLNQVGLNVPHEYRGLIIMALLSNLALFAVYNAVLICLWIVRGWRSKAPEATGRWATKSEIKRYFWIISQLGHLLAFRVFPAAGMIVSILFVFSRINGNTDIVFFLLLAAAAGLLYVGDYSDYRKRAMPYPLGRYKGLRPCLIGGIRGSLLYGTAKEQRQEHVLIIGPTGTGKTSAYFIPPLLEDAAGNCSAVVIEAKVTGDDKDDMLKLIGPTWFANNKKVLIFDPWSDEKDGKNTLHFNPLLNLKADFEDGDTRETIDEIVDAVYRTSAEISGTPSSDGAFHEGNEKRLLRGLLYISLFKPPGQRNMTAIRHIVGGNVETVVSYINTAASQKDKALTDYIKRELIWFTSSDSLRPDAKAHTLTGIANKLEIFDHPDVKECTVNNDLDLNLIFREPCLLVVKSPMDIIGANILASIITRLLMLKSHRKLTYGAGEEFKVWFYLDELPTLCLPELSKFVATARSAGVGVIAAVQDKADLSSSIVVKRGTNSIEGLLSNMKTKIILPGCGPDTAEYFSKAWGMQSTDQTTMTRGVFDIVDFRYMKTQRTHRLISSDDIYKMDKRHAVIDIAHARPFRVRTERWFESRRYRKMVRKNSDVQVWRYKPEMPEGGYIEFESPIKSISLTDEKKVTQRLGLGEALGTPGSSVELDISTRDSDFQTMRRDREVSSYQRDMIALQGDEHHHEHKLDVD